MAKTQIYEQEEALSVYFRDMLAEPKPKPVASQPAPLEVKVEPEPAPEKLNAESEPESQMAEVQHEETEMAVPAVSTETTAETGIVHKLLLCEVGGVKLAVAVSELNNIVHWPQQGLNQLPGQADWQLGLLNEQRQHAEVIDIRPILQAPDSGTAIKAGYILLVDERRRGIACDRIKQIINIDDNDINWRQDRSQRPWFSGVVADSMHSIVDVPALLAALETGNMA